MASDRHGALALDDDLALDGDAGPLELDDDDDRDPGIVGAAASPAVRSAYADLGPWWQPLAGVEHGERSHLHPDGSPRIVERRFTVTEDFAGHRLDHYLKRMIPRLSRTKLQAVIRTQLTRDSGRPFRVSTSVVLGEQWLIRRPARAEPPCPRTFDVLHHDDAVLVVGKPPGLPVHASAKFYFNTLARVVSERFPDGDWQLCHRLDRETSGVLVMASGRAASSALKTAFASKTAVEKTYLAIVHGDPPWPDDGAGDTALDHPLALAGPGDPSRLPSVRMLVRPGGLPSMTRVSVVERVPGYALVRCRLITGRQHQIRAHVAHAGYPIVGDKLYTAGEDAFIAFCDRGMTRELATRLELPRQALHAWRVRVPHPVRGGALEVTSPLAWDLASFLAAKRAR